MYREKMTGQRGKLRALALIFPSFSLDVCMSPFSGEREGKDYDEIRNHASLVRFDEKLGSFGLAMGT